MAPPARTHYRAQTNQARARIVDREVRRLELRRPRPLPTRKDVNR